jgi:hypothetical protein
MHGACCWQLHNLVYAKAAGSTCPEVQTGGQTCCHASLACTSLIWSVYFHLKQLVLANDRP